MKLFQRFRKWARKKLGIIRPRDVWIDADTNTGWTIEELVGPKVAQKLRAMVQK